MFHKLIFDLPEQRARNLTVGVFIVPGRLDVWAWPGELIHLIRYDVLRIIVECKVLRDPRWYFYRGGWIFLGSVRYWPDINADLSVIVLLDTGDYARSRLSPLLDTFDMFITPDVFVVNDQTWFGDGERQTRLANLEDD